MPPFGISIDGFVPLFAEFRFDRPVDWTISAGEHWAVVGPNGAGKTLLSDILQGNIARREGGVRVDGVAEGRTAVSSISFRDIYSLADARESYYQQRWNTSDAQNSPTVESIAGGVGADRLKLFGVDRLLGKRLIHLSSGEVRKLLIIRKLAENPQLLILDNPFIGLDAASREHLGQMLHSLSRMEGLQVVLIVSDIRDIPMWVDRVQPVLNRSLIEPMTRDGFMADKKLHAKLFPGLETAAIGLPVGTSNEPGFETLLHMEDVRVAYGDKVILSGENWTVRRGESWALLGDNGSGKSTLLSLVCGDNPQAYANRITLFDRRRGTGESIWDIKRRIGYLSADLHTYYLKNIPCSDVVVSGLFDSVGLFGAPTAEQHKKALAWMEVFGIGHLADRSFVKVSYGEQRLVLLARSFVKNPEVLILDEPLHGLDSGKKRLAIAVIEKFCAQKGKSLIYVTHYLDEIPACVKKIKKISKRKS